MTSRSLFAIALTLAALPLAPGCTKKEDLPPPVRACVLTDETGKTAQCFEWQSDKPLAQQQADCNEFEVYPGGKKALIEGVCPAQGRLGACVNGAASKTVCYSNADACKRRCVGVGTWAN